MRASLLWPVLALLTASAHAAGRELSVTIYNNDLALVQDRRDIDLTGGRQRHRVRKRLGADPRRDGRA